MYAYNILCSTNDNITIHLHRWFYLETTRWIAYSEDEANLTYLVNGRNKEPRGVTGATSWSYDETTTTVSVASANNTMVTIVWLDTGTSQTLWYLERVPMWLGIVGMLMMSMSPFSFVFFAKRDEYASACIWMLGLFIIGLGLFIGWLW